MWKSRGVDGLVVQTKYLDEMGGTEMWTSDPNAPLSGVIDEGADVHVMQRKLRDSRFAERCHERGIQVYLGMYLSNYHNLQTPLKVWTDDTGWKQVTQLARDFAGAAKLLGMDGLATDSEMYRDDSRQTWNWDYPGNTQSEATVRALAKQRGKELMEAILAGFPNVEIINYRIEIPGSWEEQVQAQVNKVQGVWNRSVFVDFWGGMVEPGGFYAIYFLDPIFYKSWHIRSGWDEAMQANRDGVRRTLSERWSNWSYASTRFFITPFVWIDPGPSAGSFDDARPPDYVAAQLDAAHKWGEGRTFGLYTQHIDDFDYAPYVPAMQRASTPDAGTASVAARTIGIVRDLISALGRDAGLARVVRPDRVHPALRLERVARGLDQPADMAFARDGRLFVAERGGAVRVMRDGRLAQTPALTLDDVWTAGGSGLLALALDPDFERSHYVYALYTAVSRAGDPVYRIARFREVHDTLGERAVLLDGVAAPVADAAGALRFGPDGKLYAALDQDVLRLNADGTTPEDQRSPVFARRDVAPRSLDWQGGTGTLWTAARSIAFYRGDLMPWLTGDLLMAGADAPALVRGKVDVRNPSRMGATETLIGTAGGPITALTPGPDGAIYLCASGELWRLVPSRSH